MEKEFAKNLLYKPTYAHLNQDRPTVDAFCNAYRAYMDASKTERDAVRTSVEMAEKAGFTPYVPGQPLVPGQRIYRINREKSLMLAVIGSESLARGFRVIASHIDSPRLDLKPMPLYESSGIGYFKTHYYGGIKKSHWAALPLALHGVVYLKDGTRVNVCIGEDENDPVLYISDLMPHIAKDQVAKTASNVISGESLNLITGSLPFDEEEGVKLNVLSILHEKYGMEERDFMTAELSAVPAQKSREVGLDRSMIAAYGMDDKICAYPSLRALEDLDVPKHTCVVFLADKEEIGSEGVTGLRSEAYAAFLRDLCADAGVCDREAFRNSLCLSADVGGAYDPCYAEAYEANNSCYIGKGVVVSKYTGSRGKGGCSDASAEVMSRVALLLDGAGIAWQTGEYGKVDQGGAGTVAVEIAKFGIDVVDVGVPLLSMHAPSELAAKSDIYAMYGCCKAVFND